MESEKAKQLYREVGPNDRIEVSGMKVGDSITIKILPAKRGRGRSRGRRMTAAIDLSRELKVLTVKQRPVDHSIDKPPRSA